MQFTSNIYMGKKKLSKLLTTFENPTPPILQSGAKEAAIILAVLIFLL